jgi:hypothetical protein
MLGVRNVSIRDDREPWRGDKTLGELCQYEVQPGSQHTEAMRRPTVDCGQVERWKHQRHRGSRAEVFKPDHEAIEAKARRGADIVNVSERRMHVLTEAEPGIKVLPLDQGDARACSCVPYLTETAWKVAVNAALEAHTCCRPAL